MDIVERLVANSKWRNEHWRCVIDPILVEEAATEIARLREENKRMRDALKPFGEWADWFDSCDQHHEGCPDEADVGEAVDITVGQLRQARTALAATGGE